MSFFNKLYPFYSTVSKATLEINVDSRSYKMKEDWDTSKQGIAASHGVFVGSLLYTNDVLLTKKYFTKYNKSRN